MDFKDNHNGFKKLLLKKEKKMFQVTDDWPSASSTAPELFKSECKERK